MDKDSQINLHYDEEADVMYISFGKPVPSTTILAERGILIRVDESENRLSGITILDYKYQTQSKR